MGNMYFHYGCTMAGITLELELPFPVRVMPEAEEFFFPCGEGSIKNPDFRISFVRRARLHKMPDEGVWEGYQYFTRLGENRTVFHAGSRTDRPYAEVTWLNGGEIQCSLAVGCLEGDVNSRQILNLLGLEALLLEGRGLLLHAAFIRWKQKGVLFSAPSGTGKSTQAGLWTVYEGAEIINDDRAGLRLWDGKWQAWGVPYAGSSAVSRNETVPVEAIIVVRRGQVNSIRLLSAPEAVRFLYPELSIHHWDRDFTEKSMDILVGLAEDVPVYLMECLPDRSAVQMLRDTILQRSVKSDEKS
ncbi:MAG: hypothetical protein Q4C58_11020 [Eubacteriales bacterium]|nr:hypothetical protein [Eubacteriales bacterium]